MRRAEFLGVRASISASGCEYQESGGDTICVLLDGPECTVILDAGSGIRELGKELASPGCWFALHEGSPHMQARVKHNAGEV